MQYVVLGSGPVQSSIVDVLIVIPSRAVDYQLMDHARRSEHVQGVMK